jgi:methionyl-tRNA formyltransferase
VNESPFRIAFFGLPLAATLLARDGHELSLAVLSPVAAPGRRRLAQHVARERVFDVLARGAAFETDVDAALRAEPPSLIVSWFWTRRLPERWLSLARFGAIGAHPSLLPRHRGPNPYYAAIDAGDRETGVSVHRLTPRYDDGEILLESKLAVAERDAWQLARALDRPSLALLREAVQRFAQGVPPVGRAQDETRATWAPEPDGDALKVDWSWPTERVLRRIRALAPVPGLVLEIEGLSVVVVRARAATGFPEALEHGEGAVVGDPPRFVLRTGDSAVAVERALLESGVDAEDAVLSASDLAAAIQAHLSGRRAQVS